MFYNEQVCFVNRLLTGPTYVASAVDFLNDFFSLRLLSVLPGHSVFASTPQWPMTSDFEGFLYHILSITIFSYLNS